MFIVQLIEATYNFLWGDLFQIPLPGGGSNDYEHSITKKRKETDKCKH